MSTQHVNFPSNGSSASGVLATPDTSDPKPGVVVIQEWWGLNDHIIDVTERFARAGFVALAPDLYHGKVVTEPDDARKEVMALDFGRAVKEITGAAAYLKALPSVMPKKIGVVGFCMGGGLALRAGVYPDFGAVVAFYGGRPPEASAYTGANAAVLGIVGDLDTGALAGMRDLDESLTAAGYPHPHALVIYPGAQHAFFNDTRTQVYDADAAKDAWGRTLNWFGLYLK